MTLTIRGIQELEARIGQELGVSSWHHVQQRHIDAFAAATDDYEPLHLDSERARGTPWGVTIAHGLYTLSLGPKFLYEIYAIEDIPLWLNYGFERTRFISPLPVGSRVRMRAQLTAITPARGVDAVRAHITQTFERDGQERPVCVAEAIYLYFRARPTTA